MTDVLECGRHVLPLEDRVSPTLLRDDSQRGSRCGLERIPLRIADSHRVCGTIQTGTVEGEDPDAIRGSHAGLITPVFPADALPQIATG